MKAPWFDYQAPTSLADALAVLGQAEGDGRVLAGGQSLMPMLNMRIADPAVLVDINRIPGLDGIEETDASLSVGALVRHADILNSDAVRARWPLLLDNRRRTTPTHPARTPERAAAPPRTAGPR